MKYKLILVFNVVYSGITFGQGFSGTTEPSAGSNKFDKVIGKTFTLMPNPGANPLLKCVKHLGHELIDKPTLRTTNTYESPAPIQYTVESIVASLDPYSSGTKYLKIIINDHNKTTAYYRDYKFHSTKLDGKVVTALRGCNFEGPAEDVIKEIEKAKNSSQISIGMTSDSVENETDWGSPDNINILQTEKGTESQWVYSKFWKKGYLYFNKYGILTAIQN